MARSPSVARRARAAVLVVLPVLLATAIGAGAVVACASFREEVAAGGDAAADGSSEAAAPSPKGICAAADAFCDSFDDDVALPRRWTDMATKGDASIARIGDAGLDGSGGLLVTMTGDGTNQSAFLFVDTGVNGPPAYTAVLSFAAKLMTTGGGVVLGPRFSVDHGGVAGSRDVIVSWRANLTRLEHYAPGCGAGCTVPNADIGISADWHRYVLTVHVHSGDASDYGDIAYEVDGRPAASGPLTFSLASPKAYGFQVGVTFSSGTVPGAVAFDDVSLLVTP